MHSAGNAMPAAGGEETAMVLSSAEPSMLQYWPARQEAPTAVVKLFRDALLDVRPAPQEGSQGW